MKFEKITDGRLRHLAGKQIMLKKPLWYQDIEDWDDEIPDFMEVIDGRVCFKANEPLKVEIGEGNWPTLNGIDICLDDFDEECIEAAVIEAITDQELFIEMVDRICLQNKLEVTYPFNDSYFELVKEDGEVVCNMNPSGHNLLANIHTLSTQLANWYLR